jgi:hypothetical protein
MSQRISSRLAVVPLLVLAACSDSGREAGALSVADSAGVRIVEHPASQQLPVWTVSATPTLVVGGGSEEAGVQFGDVVAAALLDDGSIGVADAGNHNVRVFAASGDSAATLGREGDGPGEFRQIGAVWRLAGDSLAVWDFQVSRLTVFSRDGSVGRVIVPQPAPSGSYHPMWGLFGDGSFILGPGMDIAGLLTGGTHVRRDTVPLLRYGADGRLADTIGVYPGDEKHVLVSGAGFNVRTLPYGRRLRIALGGERLYLTTGDKSEVVALTPAGARVMVSRERRPPAPVTDTDRSAHRQRQLRDLSPDKAEVERKRLDQLPFPGTMAPYAQLLLDRSGFLWMRRTATDAPDQAQEWVVLAPDGRTVASVTTPAGLEVLDIGADALVGVAGDEMDVEQVQRYALSREPAAT